MKPPAPTWECTYRHERRRHAHRCRACNRVIRDGAPVLMARVSGGATWAVHAECADAPHPCGTWRDAFTTWGREYLKRTGHYRTAAPA